MIKKRVALGLSGGVDSAVSAFLLQEAGYEVIGLTMDLGIDGTQVSEARELADFFKIEHRVISLADDFRQEVILPFVDEYLHGRTPNPCVVCNRRIKFGRLWDEAKKLGADFLATGHYARVGQVANGEYRLYRGRDEKKDQSYFLYRIPHEILPNLIFPLGEFLKSEVRALATENGIPVADKADSQEICFLPADDYREFLQQEAGTAVDNAGWFVDSAGERLGRHRGLAHYTIGQRKGLGLALGYPAYVIKLSAEDNTVIIGKAEELYAAEAEVVDVNWLVSNPDEILAQEEKILVKIRSTAPPVEAAIVSRASGGVKISFRDKQRAITPGQSAVFYLPDGSIIGGGTINK